jgi:hypothetical protein
LKNKLKVRGMTKDDKKREIKWDRWGIRALGRMGGTIDKNFGK